MNQPRGKRRLAIQRSSSADKVAMLRAYGALDRDAAVRNPDFLAGDFLSDIRMSRLMLRLGSHQGMHACGRWAFECVGRGNYWMETARVKHFDLVLMDEVSKGIRQVVVLGAGLDSRAYRFSRQLDGVRLIEVDHPTMAARKRERVTAVFGALPPHVTYLSLDLTRDDLSEGLSEVGFEADAPVLVLWIGVSMYLPGEAVASVLRWVAACPDRSSIGFDYLDRRFFDASRRFGSRWRMQQFLKLNGEHLIYGLDRSTISTLMSEYGLTLKGHLGPADIEARYLRRENGKLAGRPSPYFGFVHAG